jgi:uncharacterized protein (TIGR03083 family)
VPADADVAAAFHESSETFVTLVASIDEPQWEEPGTGEWTVLELVAHTMRAFVAIDEVLVRPLDPASRRLAGAADYYRVAMSMAGVHDGISARARDGAALIKVDPPTKVRVLADRVGQLVDATPGDREVQHYAGRITFRDYLVTRLTELVLHCVDIQCALGIEPRAPVRAAALVRDELLVLAEDADALAVACALSGRGRVVACDVLS